MTEIQHVVGHQYGPTSLAGHATALIGDNYGSLTINHNTVSLNDPSSLDSGQNFPTRVIRSNKVLPTHTIETITSFRDGGPPTDRGVSSQVDILWDRRGHLGSGLFGEVHREDYSQNGRIVKTRAVKVLRRLQLERMKVDYKKELDALISLSQPAYLHMFVEYYSWYETQEKIFLAMEYVPCGDLACYIGKNLSENDAKQIGYQVLDGIRTMHRLDIVHRDIKPANIFVVRRAPTWWVKIGDFSICKRTVTHQTTLHTQVGTIGYQAPEIMSLVDTEKKAQYNAKCDVWSFGCLIFEIITSHVPFATIGDLSNYCYYKSSRLGWSGILHAYPSHWQALHDAGASQEAFTLLTALLQVKPYKRPTSEEAMMKAAAWFESRRDPQGLEKMQLDLTSWEMIGSDELEYDPVTPPLGRHTSPIPSPPAIWIEKINDLHRKEQHQDHMVKTNASKKDFDLQNPVSRVNENSKLHLTDTDQPEKLVLSPPRQKKDRLFVCDQCKRDEKTFADAKDLERHTDRYHRIIHNEGQACGHVWMGPGHGWMDVD